MLSQMSAVNMKALEIYEQVEREYTKLIEKKADQIKLEIELQPSEERTANLEYSIRW